MTKSKRFKITAGALLLNFTLMLIGIILGTDLIALGTGLVMVNAPLYGYLWGETSRPSGTKSKNHEEMKKSDE